MEAALATDDPAAGRKPWALPSLDDSPWLWFLPVVALLLVVTLYPLAFVFWMSVEETRYYDLVGFVGFKNYVAVFRSHAFWDSSKASLLFVFGSLGLALPLGLMAAVVFHELGRYASFFRVITLLPWTLSMAVVASIWLWLLNPAYGPVNYALQSVGVSPGLMLGDPDVAIYLLIIATGWWSFPYVMVIVTAALQSIPKELYEAVEIDGGGFLPKFRHVAWPHLRPTIGSTGLTLGILYLTIVTLILVLTGGGPLGATATWSYEVFRGTVQTVNIAPAAVYSVVVLAANLVLGIIYVRTTGRVTA